MHAPRRWTKEDDDLLQELTAAGRRTNAIGKELHRSEPAIIQESSFSTAANLARSKGSPHFPVLSSITEIDLIARATVH
jgi:hypothetical protein